MKIEDLKLARWFKNRLKTIVKHNNQEEDKDITFEACNAKGLWTPCDLIAREELNNGSGSAEGFLGITPSENRKCYDYMKQNKDYLVEQHLVSEKAWNNSGFPLWSDYNF